MSKQATFAVTTLQRIDNQLENLAMCGVHVTVTRKYPGTQIVDKPHTFIRTGDVMVHCVDFTAGRVYYIDGIRMVDRISTLTWLMHNAVEITTGTPAHTT